MGKEIFETDFSNANEAISLSVVTAAKTPLSDNGVDFGVYESTLFRHHVPRTSASLVARGNAE